MLRRRPEANGFNEHEQIETVDGEPIDEDASVIDYTNVEGERVRIKRQRDSRFDVFQIGRQLYDAKIDFLINESENNNSEISRFAFRIQVNRETFEARIYAAGYDSGNKIFLGKKAKQWRMDDGTVDGLSTNGLWVLFNSNDVVEGEMTREAQMEKWREVSVTGKLYPCIDNRHNLNQHDRFANEENVLKDFSIIDVKGMTLVWRCRAGELEFCCVNLQQLLNLF